MWRAWAWDLFTGAWTVMLVWFAAWEAAALAVGYRHTFTAHLRPVFLAFPVTWWLALGLWLWAGVHLLAPSVEQWLLDTVGRGTP